VDASEGETGEREQVSEGPVADLRRSCCKWKRKGNRVSSCPLHDSRSHKASAREREEEEDEGNARAVASLWTSRLARWM